MTIKISPEQVPLALDQDGVIHVGGTRVTLDTIVYDFREGATAEEIALRYPSLNLSDIYSALGYYLQRHKEIDEYLRLRSIQAEGVRAEMETHFDPSGIRDRLMARARNRK